MIRSVALCLLLGCGSAPPSTPAPQTTALTEVIAAARVDEETEPPADILAALADDARTETFEELSPAARGTERGVEHGVDADASESDFYRGLLMTYFRRGWTLPSSSIDPDTARDLVAMVEIQLGPNMEIVEWRLRQSSGHTVFDESIAAQMARLQASSTPPPMPPASVASQYLGQRIVIRYRGRDSR